jgi:uncharacterized membrane protein
MRMQQQLYTVLDAILSLEAVYIATGLLLWIFAIIIWRDHTHSRRIGAGFFWCILGVIFAFGSLLPHAITGILVVLLVVLDGTGQVESRHVRELAPGLRAVQPTARLFLPIAAIPCATLLMAAGFYAVGRDFGTGALVGFGVGAVVSMLAVLKVTGGTWGTLLNEGRKLNETMGSVNILPQLLASLGSILLAAHVGDLVTIGVRHLVPTGNLFFLAFANCFGMTALTILLGNSFAAFPVIAAGVSLRLIVEPLGVDPAMVAIITLSAGASGTLVTPMAANFNAVPARLLGMRSEHGVIRFQWPFALAMWLFHVLLLWLLIRG